LGVISCIGVVSGGSGDPTPAGWVIFSAIAACVGAAVGAIFARASLAVAERLSQRTAWWLPVVISTTGVVAGTLTALNVLNQGLGSVLSLGSSGFATGAAVAWFALHPLQHDALRDSVGLGVTIATSVIVSVVFGSVIVIARHVWGESAVAFSPGAFVVYGVLFAGPLMVLLLVVGGMVGLFRGRPGRR
jgi:hypothetical protein